MLDPQVIRLTTQFIEVEFEKRRQSLEAGTLAIAERLNKRGILNSSIHADEVIKLCKAEIETRARIIVEVHANILTQLNIQPYPDLVNELKERLRLFLPLRGDYMVAVDHEKRIGLHRPQSASNELAAAREQELKRQDAQIELTVFSSLSKSQTEATQNTSVTHNYIINAPVGAFQTGAGAVATVSQTFNAGDRATLVKALELVKDAIQREKNINTFNRAEVIELINDGKAEVEKPKPNGTKLASIMNTVSSAIKTVETFQSVYQTLKNALGPFGITLP